MSGKRFLTLKPRNIRALRHWATELMIVIVGVLCALMAAEWANNRRDKIEAERAADAMTAELQTISFVMYISLLNWECQNQQIEKLYNALLATDDPWSPSDLAITETQSNRQERSSIPVYFDDDPYIRHFTARDNAEARGAFQNLDTVRSQPIALLYSIAETAYAANVTRYESSRRLVGLSLSEAPSNAERRDMLNTLGEVYEQHELFFRYAQGFLSTWDQYEDKPDHYIGVGFYSDFEIIRDQF